jgi:hypothetical protein
VAERERIDFIQRAVGAQGLGVEVAAQLIARKVSKEAASVEILDKVAARGDAAPTRTGAVVTDDHDAVHRAAIENALLHRHDPRGFELSEAGRMYRGMTLLEMGGEYLARRGLNVRAGDKMERAGVLLGLATRSGMHTVSDFPFILANVANKTLRRAYQAAPRTFLPFVRIVSASDFKTISRVQLGDAPSLERVPESGEYKRGTVGEAREQYRVETFGKVVAVTRQVIVNDDLSAFTRLP